jgi:hypothetical protein
LLWCGGIGREEAFDADRLFRNWTGTFDAQARSCPSKGRLLLAFNNIAVPSVDGTISPLAVVKHSLATGVNVPCLA